MSLYYLLDKNNKEHIFKKNKQSVQFNFTPGGIYVSENILNLIAEYTTVTEELKSIVDKNIICGNYLENIDEDGNELVFYEWLDDGYKIHKAADI